MKKGTNYCIHCGSPLEKDAKFCSSCGKAILESKPVTAGNISLDSKKGAGISRRQIGVGIITGLVLTAICSPLVLITRGEVMDSLLNPEMRSQQDTTLSSAVPSSGSSQPSATSESQLQPTSEIIPTKAPEFPDIPIVYTSDREAPNYDQCHPEESCFLQVFYNPASLTGQAVNLTGPLGFAATSDPVLSPDRTRVAFTGFVEGAAENHIYIVNTDGTGLRVMTLKGFNHGHPSWSPDGQRLVVMSVPTGENNYHLYLIDVESREARQLTGGEYMDRFPDWSPNGDVIAFHSNRADPNSGTCWPNCRTDVYLVDVITGLISPLSAGEEGLSGGAFAWSPDGTRLAFHSFTSGSWDIYIREVDGTVRQLTSDPGEELFPAWSPDGQFIAYAGYTPAGSDIIVTPADFFDPLNYTGGPAFDLQPDW